jgi:hypothetical protein
MYTFPVCCTTDSRFRPKANLPRTGKYRSSCCVMMGPRTTVCYCTPHASHGVEQTPCHAMHSPSPVPTILHFIFNQSVCVQPTTSVSPSSCASADANSLSRRANRAAASASSRFGERHVRLSFEPVPDASGRRCRDEAFLHCSRLWVRWRCRPDSKADLLPSKSHRFSSHTQIGVPGVRDMSTRANDRLPR